MIVQDTQTGAFHQVPDHLSGYGDYGDRTVYDGYGNPIGQLAGIFDDIGRAVRGAVSAIPGIGPMVSNLLPGGAMGPPIPPTPSLPGQLPHLPMPGLPFRPPWPTGWVRPPLPYTGLGPRRLYMRCAVWPGPRGLVPGYAQTMMPQPGMPGVPGAPGVPPQALPAMGGGRHHRRHHRRR